MVVRLQGEHGGGGDPVLWMRSGALRASDGGPALGRFPISPRGALIAAHVLCSLPHWRLLSSLALPSMSWAWFPLCLRELMMP